MKHQRHTEQMRTGTCPKQLQVLRRYKKFTQRDKKSFKGEPQVAEVRSHFEGLSLNRVNNWGFESH